MTEEETIGRFLAGHLDGMAPSKMFAVLTNLVTWSMMAAYNFDQDTAAEACDVLCHNAKEMIAQARVPANVSVREQ